MDPKSLLEKYKIQLGVGILGVVLLGIAAVFLRPAQPEIEILPAEEKSPATIWVDIEGAIQKPGVYELSANSRLNDLLIRAGGLSALADREWAAKSLNLAQPLADGNKIYIPGHDETPHSLANPQVGGEGEAGPSGGQVAGSKVTAKININTASLAELDSLWGIGAKRAQTIIDSRPYQSAEELLTRKIIPQNVYERIKNEIVIY